jgi:hypothetical protein
MNHLDEVLRLRALIEESLAEMGLPPLTTDAEGNHLFRYGSAGGTIVAVGEGEYSTLPEIRVDLVAARGLRASRALLAELNSINQTPTGATVYFCEGEVHVAAVLLPGRCTPLEIASAMAFVGGLASDIGPMLAAVYGGTTPHPFAGS